MVDKTVIYYSSNHELPEFEALIVDTIKQNCGDLPIVSVTQKPMNFGTNICVGNVGFSAMNIWRQTLIAAKAATTKYVIYTESDVLYPPDYFAFDPPKDRTLYRYDNIWVMFNRRRFLGRLYSKGYTEGAQICDRELLIETYDAFLKNAPEWLDGSEGDMVGFKGNEPFRRVGWEMFHGDAACISCKTGHGLRNMTDTNPNIKPVTELPYWGDVRGMNLKYFGRG